MAEAKNILVALPLSQAQKERIEAAADAADVRFAYAEQPSDEQLACANVIIGMVPVEKLPLAKQLEWLQLSWAGAGPYCAPGALPADVTLTCASGAYGLACSEHLLAFTFDLLRRFPEYHRNLAQHVWKTAGHITSVEGSTVVVLGMGDIGGDYARKMNALGARIVGVRRTQKPAPSYAERVVTVDELDEVLPEADIVAMALPGSDATAHIIDERRLRLMKPNAYLLNVGRGNAIEFTGLKKVLQEGLLAGVALDVTDPEPLPADDWLWSCERVFITPHVAGQLLLPETLERVVGIAADNLAAWLAGKPLAHVVDRALGY